VKKNAPKVTRKRKKKRKKAALSPSDLKFPEVTTPNI